MTTITRLTPPLKPCHACGHEYAGTHCPVCKEENPSYTAIKNIGKKPEETCLLGLVSLAGEVC